MPTHTRDLIFSSIDFLPETELLLCCGKVCECCVCVCVCCYFIVFLEGCVCLKETDQETTQGKKRTKREYDKLSRKHKVFLLQF